MFSATFSCSTSNILLIHYQNSVKPMLYIFKEFEKYGFLRHNVPLKKRIIHKMLMICSSVFHLKYTFLVLY
jgi:hypothetical protein